MRAGALFEEDEMGLFDKMFKKSSFEEKMDGVFESVVEKDPITKLAKKKVGEAEDEITRKLRRELYKATGEKRAVNGEGEELMQEWDSMMDQIIGTKLSSIKICPACNEAAPADQEICPHCGAQLPDHTADVQICPHCGAKNKPLDFECANCGESLEP